MNVEVRLFATLRQGRFIRENRTLEERATLGDLLGLLEMGRDEVGVAVVNGRHAARDRVLCHGDVVALFPAVAGG